MFLMNRGESRFDACGTGKQRRLDRAAPARRARRIEVIAPRAQSEALGNVRLWEGVRRVSKAGQGLIMLAVLLAEARNPHHAVDRGD